MQFAIRLVVIIIAGVALLFVVFLIVVMVVTAMYGIAAVRADIFGQFANVYWTLGMALAVLGAILLAFKKRTSADGKSKP